LPESDREGAFKKSSTQLHSETLELLPKSCGMTIVLRRLREQLTFLLVPEKWRMNRAGRRSIKPSPIPKGFGWAALTEMDGDD